ncbi:MAG TPA: esterase-like activity of phytase family protein [Vicinamibacteria bacterium]|nr:esterase-like activity of phytase family protein [Vicinamibacteria bacterium]
MRNAGSLLALVFTVGCGVDPVAETPHALQIEFLTDLVVPPSPDFGGISAIVFDESSGTWLALSDAKTDHRFFELGIDFADGRLHVETKSVTHLVGFPGVVLDPEGLAPSPWHTLFLSSDADLQDDHQEDAKLLEFDRQGRWLSNADVPTKFLLGEGRGARNNLGFESLAISSDGSRLFLGMESALVQDGPAASLDNAAFCRIIEYRVTDRRVEPEAEYVYPVGPIAPASELGEVEASGGLVELVALSASRVLALERMLLRSVDGDGEVLIRVRLYDVDFSSATDVSALESLESDGDWRPVTKELLVDFDDVVPRLSPEYRRLDNFEAMVLGPELRDGRRSLVVVSDDNFSEEQRTVFLLFGLNGLN